MLVRFACTLTGQPLSSGLVLATTLVMYLVKSVSSNAAFSTTIRTWNHGVEKLLIADSSGGCWYRVISRTPEWQQDE